MFVCVDYRYLPGIGIFQIFYCSKNFTGKHRTLFRHSFLNKPKVRQYEKRKKQKGREQFKTQNQNYYIQTKERKQKYKHLLLWPRAVWLFDHCKLPRLWSTIFLCVCVCECGGGGSGWRVGVVKKKEDFSQISYRNFKDNRPPTTIVISFTQYTAFG